MKYKTVRSIVRFIMNMIARVEVRGMEREDIIMPIAVKYKNHPLYGMLGRLVNAIWLNRFEADYAALREILKRMEHGGMMVIAPEGTRSKTEALQEGKPGVAFLAGKSGYLFCLWL
ncbi:MAG: 1-acyl-sn-glycerol-3-phosphate acyltransferase [Anaerolineales bacterium]|nr:1-acyl-sn-glycerol-3-phosphate acyltransferase [Anaerolineales bacterium]